jgi:Na+-transporting NADH:ubiquinone oxidoreductase subunit B
MTAPEFATAPGPRRRWTPLSVTLVQVLALLPPAGWAVAQGGWAVLAVAAAATLLWEAGFALLRRRRVTWHGITTALIVAVMLPPALPLWQVALSVSFGVVLGEMVFGGRGFGFVSAAAAALAFQAFSFPATVLAGGAVTVAALSLPGALLLVLAGLLSWRIVLAALAAAWLALAGAGAAGAAEPLAAAAALSFALVFLIGDPLAAAATDPGRWLHGALAGALAVLFGAGAVTPQAAVFAALLASLFAPLLDHLVILADAELRRRRRHG